jgi:hypothetical protein
MCEKTMCRACGQPLPPKEREGVYLPATKVAVFDFIDRHPGVTPAGVLAHCFPDRPENSSGLRLVYTHVNQINSMLESTNIRIISKERGTYRVFRPSVIRGKPALPAR